jgi:hypothetical protein
MPLSACAQRRPVSSCQRRQRRKGTHRKGTRSAHESPLAASFSLSPLCLMRSPSRGPALSGQGHRSPLARTNLPIRSRASTATVAVSLAACMFGCAAAGLVGLAAAAAAAGTAPPPEASWQGVWSVYDPWWQRRCGCPSACRVAAGQQPGARGWANVARWLAGRISYNIISARARIKYVNFTQKYADTHRSIPDTSSLNRLSLRGLVSPLRWSKT